MSELKMNALLEKALAEVAPLPDAEQEAIAGLILDEIAAERGWDERFAETQDQLGDLVRAARAEAARGEVLPGDPSDPQFPSIRGACAPSGASSMPPD